MHVISTYYSYECRLAYHLLFFKLFCLFVQVGVFHGLKVLPNLFSYSFAQVSILCRVYCNLQPAVTDHRSINHITRQGNIIKKHSGGETMKLCQRKKDLIMLPILFLLTCFFTSSGCFAAPDPLRCRSTTAHPRTRKNGVAIKPDIFSTAWICPAEK